MDFKSIINYITASWGRITLSIFLLGILFSFLIPPLGGLFTLSSIILYFVKIKPTKPKKEKLVVSSNRPQIERENTYVFTDKDLVRRDKSDKFNYDYNQYFRLLTNRPHYYDFSKRDLAKTPAFDDSYKTDEGYKLRELLLLVWWGQTKNGRKSSVALPKYFFEKYNLNASKLTQNFFANNLLNDDGEKILLTDEGKKLYQKYQSLWEIHSFKGEFMNLDQDFQNWDLTDFTIHHYKIKIQYLKAENSYIKEMNEFLLQSEYPEDKEERLREYQYNIEANNRNNMEINNLQEKIEILENK